VAQPTASTAWWRSFTPHHWFVYLTCSMAWLFDSLDQQLFNLARDAAVEDLLNDPALATVYAPYTTSVFLVGWAIGGLSFGALGDRYGRAKMLTFTVLLYSLFTGLSAFASSYWEFNLYRLLTGIGVGGVFGLAVALIADTIPDHTRTPALGLLQGLSLWGNMAAGGIGMALGILAAHQALPGSLAPWQLLFLIGSLPAFLSLLIFRHLKEPEKWLQAREAGRLKGIEFGSYKRLLLHPRWRSNAWLGLALCSAGIVGLWGIGNFHPKIVRSLVETHLAAQTLSPEALAAEKAYWSSVGLVLQNAGGFFGMMLLARLAQTWGRKKAFALGLVMSFASTALVFTSLRELNDIYWMIPLMGFGQLSVFALYAIYLPELFPTSLRSTGISFCYNVGRLVAATAPVTLGVITRSLGSDIESFRTAGLWVSLVLLAGLAALPFLPETRGQPLPDDDD
jgi:MFS family permease